VRRTTSTTPVTARITGLDLPAFRAAAARLAATLRPGDTVALRGALGAGKTTFVRAVASALHGDDPVSSPTFTFWHRYAGAPPINHLDLYRVDDPAELAELGLWEAFTPDAITLVEWPERGEPLLPSQRIEVSIEGSGEGLRALTVARR
jgi:tRNA threonylcarbamoyladenosine biosynthesis protein TsaE